MAKSTQYSYDRKTGRWRKAGKYCKAPTGSQLRKDSKGRLLDAAGKLVPKAALVAPREPAQKPKAKPKAKRAKPKPKAPVKAAKKKAAKKRKADKPKRRVAGLGPVPALPARPGRPQVIGRKPKRVRPRLVAQGDAISEHGVISSRYENVKHPEHMAEVLENTIMRSARHANIGADDVVLYGYGIEMVCTTIPNSLEKTTNFVNKLSREYPDFAFTFNQESVHVTLGSKDEPTTVERAANDLREKKRDILEIYSYLADFWEEDIGWFMYAENDDLVGYSG